MPERVRITADTLQELQRGDRISLEHHNAIVRAVKGKALSSDGIQDEAGSYSDTQPRYTSPTLEISTTFEIPEYSIFSCKDNTAYAAPLRLTAAKIGIAGFGSPMLFLTNGNIKIPADSKAVVSIVDFAQIIPIKITGTVPLVGNSCGVDLDALGISGTRHGLVCLASPVTINSITNVALVTRTREPVSFVGVVSVEIGAYVAGTNTLGFGKIKVRYRDSATAVLTLAKNPGATGTDWEIDVWQLGDTAIAVGEKVHVVEAVGIGLVVVKAAGTSAGIKTGILTAVLNVQSFANVAEITTNATGTPLYTGANHNVWDLKLNTGESIPADVKVDYSEYKDNEGNTKYKWLNAYCRITNTAPEE